MIKILTIFNFLLCLTATLTASAQDYINYEPSVNFPFGKVNPAAPNELKNFEEIIGECDCKSVRRVNNEWEDSISMVWKFKYIMNGMAIQDEVISADGRHGGSIRQYNPDSLRWYVHYYSSNFPLNKLPVWNGNRIDNGNIVLFKEQKSPTGLDGFYRITFSEISESGFNWVGEWISKDTSIVYPTWKIFCKKRQLVGHTVLQIKRADKDIPISLWYPSSITENTPKTIYQNYVDNISLEKTRAENIETYLKILNSFDKIDSTTTLDAFLQTSTNALENAPFKNKKHPLILLCGANPIYHIELAEKLASKGFLVASFPRLGKQKGERLSFDPSGSCEYQKDLKAVFDFLSTKSYTDSTNLSIVTWSFEGIPCLEYAQTNNNVKLFISFDSSLGYDYGLNLVKNSKLFSEQKIAFPLIHYTGSNMDYGKDLNLLLSLKNQNNLVQIDKSFEMTHGAFTSILSIDIPKIKSDTEKSSYIHLIRAVTYELDKLLLPTINKPH